MKTSKTRTRTKGTTNSVFRHKVGAYRSGLEEDIQTELKKLKAPYEYEPFRIAYVPKLKHYTPDFVLPNGIIVETKGYFLPEDRAKHLLLQQQYPDIDLRFVFNNANQKLNKRSKTTYAMWCDQHGFKYAVKAIPISWVKEEKEERRLDAIRKVREYEKHTYHNHTLCSN